MVDERGARRGVLPIPDRPHLGVLTYDARDPDTAFPPIEPLLPPAGAPNVLVVLLDDVGFGAGSPFGGPVRMPTAERLQRGGLTYNRFHTTALCAPLVHHCRSPSPRSAVSTGFQDTGRVAVGHPPLRMSGPRTPSHLPWVTRTGRRGTTVTSSPPPPDGSTTEPASGRSR